MYEPSGSEVEIADADHVVDLLWPTVLHGPGENCVPILYRSLAVCVIVVSPIPHVFSQRLRSLVADVPCRCIVLHCRKNHLLQLRRLWITSASVLMANHLFDTFFQVFQGFRGSRTCSWSSSVCV